MTLNEGASKLSTQVGIDTTSGATLPDPAQESRKLELNEDEFAQAMMALTSEAQRFLGSRGSALAYTRPGSKCAVSVEFDEHPSELVPLIGDTFNALAYGSGVCTTSSRFFGYMPSGGLSTAAVADAMVALTNRYAGTYSVAPVAATIENACIRWLCDMLGLPHTAWGCLLSGGTMATMTALIAARDQFSGPRERAVIYLTSQTHLCSHKALHIIGMSDCVKREIATDHAWRMEPRALARAIEEDREQGLVPWLVFATAGSTNTGASDPLASLASIAHDHGAWLHVDGAYGGPFVLTHRGKTLLEGIERADSVVVDPHKALFLPYGIGACLVRRGALLERSFSKDADYLRDSFAEYARSPSDYGPELTRHFRGLRMWLSLKVHGVRRFRMALTEKLELATKLAERIRTMESLELVTETQLTVVVFRHRDGDQATRRLLDGILARGVVHISSTKVGGELCLRACVLSYRSHQEDIDTLLNELRHVTLMGLAQ